MKLLINALTKLIIGAILLGAFLFVPAGTLKFAGAWLFLGLLFVPMIIVGAVLFVRSPKLLQKRLDLKEKQGAQKGVVALSGLMFPIGFIISALDFRFGWSHVPMWLTVTSTVIFIVGYGLYAEVLRENAYLSRTIKVEDGQSVVSTGLYGVVRHPMYLATLLIFIPIPLVLGSFWGLIPFILYPVLIVTRIIDEEKLLTKELFGYKEYKTKVRYRLIPFIW